MKKMASCLLCLMTVSAHAGGLPDIYVTEAPIADGGIYTVTIFQPPSPPNPMWRIHAWGIVNPAAAVVDTMRTGWTSGVFDIATWDSEIIFETETPGDPIYLFTSGVSGATDFVSLFGPGFSQAAVYWNDSYIGNPMIAVSSNFTWSEVARDQTLESGTTTAFAMITSSAGDALMCFIGVGFSLPLACAPIAVADADGDGVSDATDNCTVVANPDQRDSNGDGQGNACDFDYTNDCVTNFLDLPVFADAFGAVAGDANFDDDVDLDGNGAINFLDLGAPPDNFAAFFTHPPGPSATECVPPF